MNATSACPNDAILRDLLVGQLSAEEALQWSDHLLHCDVCAQRTATQASGDTLSEAVAGAKEETGCDSDPLVQDLMAKLQRLPLLRPQESRVATQADDSKLAPNATDIASAATLDNVVSAGARTAEIPLNFEDVCSFLAPAQGPAEIGRLGNYRILKVLGAGGMGVVFKAEDSHLERTVALKVMKPNLGQNELAKQRFLREARAAALLKSDYVVTIHQVSEDRGVPFLAMEFLEGVSLGDRLKIGESLSVKETLRLAIQVAKGLAAAHDKGLIHRDIKPDNIWIEPAEGSRAKILDFGLARAAAAGEQQLTQAGAILGTPAYMAPEQARGEQVDHRCDLFSLGAVLYRVLTNALPFKGNDTIATLMALALHEPAPPHVINTAIPVPLSQYVMRLLEKDPAKRPHSAKDVVADLQRLERDLEPATTSASDVVPASLSTAGNTPRNGRRLLVAACVAMLVLGPLSLFFGGTVYRVVTDQGELVVEVQDDDIDVLIRKEGLVVRDRTSKREFTLTAGDGELEILEKDGVKLLSRKFTLWRGGKTTLTITLKELAEARKKTPDAAPTFVLAKAGPLDHLDPAKIPADERFAWQPKELVAVVGEHRGRRWNSISSLSFSPDGKTIAVGGYHSAQAVLFEAATLREKALLGPAEYVALSPDGKTLASSFAMNGGNLWLWDVTGSEPKKLLKLAENGGLLAFSRDGKMLVSAWNSTVQLWDLSGVKPRERAGLKVQKPRVVALALVPDGNTLFTSSDEGKKLQLWDLSGPEPKERAVLEGHTREVLSAAFSDDGKTLATSGGMDGTVRLWDTAEVQPKVRTVLKCPRGGAGDAFFNLALAPNGKTLALDYSFGGVHSVHLYDLTGPEPVKRAEIDGGWNVLITTLALAFAPDGKTLATGTTAGVVQLWDVTGKEPREHVPLEGHTGPLAAVLAADGKTLATCDAYDNLVRLWDLTGAAPRERKVLRLSKSTSYEIALAPDGKTLASFSHHGYFGTVQIWDLTKAEPEERSRFQSPAGGMRDLTWLPDGKTLAFTSGETARLWVVSGEEPKERAMLANSRGPFTVAPDGKTLVCGTQGTPNPRVWDLSATAPRDCGVLEPKAPVQHGGYHAQARPLIAAFFPDGKTLAVVAKQGDAAGEGLLLWDLAGATPKERGFLDLGLDGSWTAACAPDGKSVVAATSKGNMVWWNVEKTLSKKVKLGSWQLPGGINSVTFAPDSRHLITANANGTAYILRLSPLPETNPAYTLEGLDVAQIPETERFPWQPKELVAVVGEHRGRRWYSISNLSFSPDGKTIAAGGHESAQAMLFDAATLRAKALLGPARFVAFSPDGKTLATAGQGGAGLWLWDVTGPEPKKAFKLTEYGGFLAFSRDGKTLASGTETNVQLWDLTGAKARERSGLEVQKRRLVAMDLAPDGNTLLTSSDEGKKLQLWDLSGPDPKERAVLEGHKGAVRSVAFSPDGKTVATSGDLDSTVRLWDVTGTMPKVRAVINGREILPGTRAAFGNLAFSPDGKILAVGTSAGTLDLIDLTGPEPIARSMPIGNYSAILAFAPDSKTLAIEDTGTGVVKLWDVCGKEPKARVPLEGHTGPLATAVVTADGKTLATCDGSDNLVRLWDLTGPAPRQRHVLRLLKSTWHEIALSADGKTLASNSRAVAVQLWDLTTAEPEERLRFPPGDISGLTLFPDGKTLAFQIADTVRLWDVSGHKANERAVLPNSARSISVAPDGKTLVCTIPDVPTSFSQSLRVWDLSGAEPREQAVLKPKAPSEHHHQNWPMITKFFADGKTLAVVAQRKGVAGEGLLLWDLAGATPKERGFLPLGLGHIMAIASAPDGKTVVAATSSGDLVWWNASTRWLSRLRTWRLPGGINSVSFAPDGRHLITANNNGTAYILRLPPPLDDTWFEKVAALPGAQQVEAVKDKLMERNPDFDGTMTHVIGQAGVVTSLSVNSDKVWDIAPLAALTGLKSLDCTATQIGDFSPLAELPLRSLRCDFRAPRDTGILGAIKTLDWINDKPAKEVLK